MPTTFISPEVMKTISQNYKDTRLPEPPRARCSCGASYAILPGEEHTCWVTEQRELLRKEAAENATFRDNIINILWELIRAIRESR